MQLNATLLKHIGGLFIKDLLCNLNLQNIRPSAFYRIQLSISEHSLSGMPSADVQQSRWPCRVDEVSGVSWGATVEDGVTVGGCGSLQEAGGFQRHSDKMEQPAGTGGHCGTPLEVRELWRICR